MSIDHITNEEFRKHTAEDMENFQKLRLQYDQSEQESRKRHEEIMKMLKPVYEAFDFKNKLGDKSMKAIVRWTKILGFILALVAVLVYLWKTFVFGVAQVGK